MWQTGWHPEFGNLAALLLDGTGRYITNFPMFAGFVTFYFPDFVDAHGLPYMLIGDLLRPESPPHFPYGYEVEPDDTPIP